jgi:transcriptional repressor NrdR
MRCPYCNSPDSRVTDSRASDNGIRRRRECIRCGLRFTTYERVQTTALLVAKADGRREEFNREKLRVGIVKACAKRPVPYREIEKTVEDIEAELQRLGHAEIRASVLGDMVMERLRRLDRVAYVRFASVYRDFQDIESFEEVVKDLREDPGQLSLMEGVQAPARTRPRKGRRRGRVTGGTPAALNIDSHTGG